MNEFAVCLLIGMGISMMGFLIVAQIEPISALVKTEDPDMGGEIKAPSTSIAPKPGIPTAPSEEKSKPQFAREIVPFPDLKLATPVIPKSELQRSQPAQVTAPY